MVVQDVGEQLENTLDFLGCEPKWRSRYWLIKCPGHEDRTPSAQCYPDGWVQCHAQCGRFHINKLLNDRGMKKIQGLDGNSAPQSYESIKKEEIKRGDFTQLWTDLEPLTDDVKGVPAKELNKLGWRWYPGGNGYKEGVFIPYFNTDRSKVPFFQIRHLSGDRRFTFAKDITPIAYGMECLPNMKKFLCFTEGSRDSVILRMAGVNAIALPSASSGNILKGMAEYAKEHGLDLVAITDNDEAGKGLLKPLENASVPFIEARTNIGKDVGDLYAEKGLDGVIRRYKMFREEV